MAKTSIFSRDYERKKKKRKRRMIIIILVLVLIGGGILVKVKLSDMDFGQIRSDLQAWIDSDNPEAQQEEEKKQEEENKALEEQKKAEEEKIKNEKKYLELKLTDGSIIKTEYEETNGIKKFKEPVSIKDMEYSLSESKTQLLITDKKQNMKIFNVDGTEKDITKAQYVSQSGSVLTKEEALSANPQYIWHSQGRFIDENKIAYVSYLPYYGNGALNKYMWIYDIASKNEITLWSYAYNDLKLGNVVKDKGLEFTAYGNNYYVDANGNVIQ